MEGKKEEEKEERRIMPSLVATTSALARKRACARTSFAPTVKLSPQRQAEGALGPLPADSAHKLDVHNGT